MVGLAGALAGLALAAVIGRAAFGSASFGAAGSTALGWAPGCGRRGPAHRHRRRPRPGLAGSAGHHGGPGAPRGRTAAACVVDAVRRRPVAAARLGRRLLRHRPERLSAGPRPGRPADAVRQLLGLRRSRPVLGRGGAAVLAPDRSPAGPGPRAAGPAQPATGRKPVGHRRRQPVTPAPHPDPDGDPARAGHRLRRIHRDLRLHLPAAGPRGRAAHQRCRRDRHRIPRCHGLAGPGPDHRPGARCPFGRAGAAPVRLRRLRPAGHVRGAGGHGRRGHRAPGRLFHGRHRHAADVGARRASRCHPDQRGDGA